MANRARSAGRAIGTAAAVAAVILAGSALAACSSTSGPAVLLVGTYHGKAGAYSSIQAAVNAAHPGDWILVAPGDYHETDDAHVTSAAQLSTGDHGGVVVHTADLHIRGMNRDTVIVDGTKAGAPTPCSSAPQFQNFGPMARGQGTGPQRHRGVEGQQRQHREPHRVQLLGRLLATRATRSGGTAATARARSA